jgi:hypothetical protein
MAVLVISYKIVDAEGHYRTMPVHYNESNVDSVTKAQEVATAFAPLFGLVSGCEIVGARADFPLTVPADPVGTDAGYRGDAGATLSFYNSGGKAHSLFIPGFLLSRLEAGKVNASDPDVTNFINGLVTGVGASGPFQATDGNELPLSAYARGFQSTRKTRYK